MYKDFDSFFESIKEEVNQEINQKYFDMLYVINDSKELYRLGFNIKTAWEKLHPKCLPCNIRAAGSNVSVNMQLQGDENVEKDFMIFIDTQLEEINKIFKEDYTTELYETFLKFKWTDSYKSFIIECYYTGCE